MLWNEMHSFIVKNKKKDNYDNNNHDGLLELYHLLTCVLPNSDVVTYYYNIIYNRSNNFFFY